MRGRVCKEIAPLSVWWITPAYAGKSTPSLAVLGLHRDHPRVCGEEAPASDGPTWRVGSPPRMRGRACEVSWVSAWSGITPAYAGKRSVKDLGAGELWDHPRVCGEEPRKRLCLVLILGSPPRMRGRVDTIRNNCRAERITPAYAGKSSPRPKSDAIARDHPRVCGEETKKIP